MSFNKIFLLLSVLYSLFSINKAFSCPDIEGEYICDPSSTTLKVTQSPEGEFYRYEFQFNDKRPISMLTDNISRPDPDNPSLFYTVRCVGNVLEWTTTPIALNPAEGEILPKEQANVQPEADLLENPFVGSLRWKKAAIPPKEQVNVQPEADLLENPFVGSLRWKKAAIPPKEQVSFQLNIDYEELAKTDLSQSRYRSLRVTSFYSSGENGILEERMLTQTPQFRVVVDDSFDLGRSLNSLTSLIAHNLSLGYLGLSPEEIAERNAEETVQIKKLPYNILDEYRTCKPI